MLSARRRRRLSAGEIWMAESLEVGDDRVRADAAGAVTAGRVAWAVARSCPLPVRVVLGGVRKLGQEVREPVLQDVLQGQQDPDGADFCTGVEAGPVAVVEALAAAV